MTWHTTRHMVLQDKNDMTRYPTATSHCKTKTKITGHLCRHTRRHTPHRTTTAPQPPQAHHISDETSTWPRDVAYVVSCLGHDVILSGLVCPAMPCRFVLCHVAQCTTVALCETRCHSTGYVIWCVVLSHLNLCRVASHVVSVWFDAVW